MRSRLLILVAALTLGLTALVAIGCGDDDDDDATTSEETAGAGTEDLGLIEEGVLTVGVDTPYEPFEIGQPPDISGYDVEIMNAIAEDMGLEPEYTATGFGTIFRDTANGQFDTAAAASDITPERERVVDFTDPYYLSSTALMVPPDSDIATVDDLAGKIVGVQDGTTQQDYAEDETEASDIRGFPEGPNAIAALATGQVEAVLIDQATAVLALEKNPDLEIVDEVPTNVFFGFAVAPDNDPLREAMNEAIATVKEDGTMEELYAKYFEGAKPPEEVLQGTNELLTDD
jgi:polar amino acid transport system substrate-binding protein